jgi:hypothetical protein
MSSGLKKSDDATNIREPLPKPFRYLSFRIAEMSITDLTYSDSNFGKVFLTQVGSGKPFMMYQDLLIKNSKFFADRQLENVEEQLIEIKDVEPAVFEAYLSWLMTGKLEFRDDEEDRGSGWMQRFFDQARGTKLYLLGDLLRDVQFRVYVLDLFIRMIEEWGISAELIGMIWEGVTSESPLRRVVLQLTVAKVDQGLLDPNAVSGTVPEEFGADVMKLAVNSNRKVDGSFPATVLRAMVEETEDEHASS